MRTAEPIPAPLPGSTCCAQTPTPNWASSPLHQAIQTWLDPGSAAMFWFVPGGE